jgi:hypothetical protein
MEIKVRNLDAQEERVETGVVQFGDDWPGVFIRGDDAFNYANMLKAVLHSTEAGSIARVATKELIDLLESSNVNNQSKATPQTNDIQTQKRNENERRNKATDNRLY